jgi:hypothetical protein
MGKETCDEQIGVTTETSCCLAELRSYLEIASPFTDSACRNIESGQ